LRKEAGLQQVELAIKLGKYQTFVSRYEVGEKMLDLPELRQICHALGIELPDFINRYEAALKEN
jgi:ribosome-binding protein aMBF1 (putative translation factor)